MCFATRIGHVRPVGCHPLDPAVRQVRDVVELGHVHRAAGGQPQQQAVASSRPPLELPLPDHVGDPQRDLLAVAQHGRVEEVGDRLRVERGVPAGQHDRVVLAPIDRVQRDPGQIESVQHVGVAEFGGEAEAEHVERAHRPVRVEGELRHVMLAHQRFQIGPDRVRALGQDPVLLVQDLVEDRHALIGQPHLVRVRVGQAPADVDRVPLLDLGVQLTADVLDRLADPGQQRFQPGKQRLGCLGLGGRHNAASLMPESVANRMYCTGPLVPLSARNASSVPHSCRREDHQMGFRLFVSHSTPEADLPRLTALVGAIEAAAGDTVLDVI